MWIRSKNSKRKSKHLQAIIYEKQKSYDDALKYHKKSLEIKEEIGDERSIAISYNNIGNLYESQNLNDKALEYCQKAYKIFSDIHDIINRIIEHYPDIKFNISGKGEVLADDALDSVIDNIISNAKMHGETSKIDITIHPQNAFTTVDIADNGKGIPDDVRDKIFDEGFTYGEKGNTGVGLYIAKELIEQWGGEISVKKNKPKGTVFILKFQNSDDSK